MPVVNLILQVFKLIGWSYYSFKPHRKRLQIPTLGHFFVIDTCNLGIGGRESAWSTRVGQFWRAHRNPGRHRNRAFAFPRTPLALKRHYKSGAFLFPTYLVKYKMSISPFCTCEIFCWRNADREHVMALPCFWHFTTVHSLFLHDYVGISMGIF